MNIDINNLNNSEKNRILEMHKKHGYSLSEQETVTQKVQRLNKSQSQSDKEELRKAAEAMMDNKEYGIPGTWDETKPGTSYKEMDIPQTIEIGSSLFKNGIANIDKTNSGYKDAISKLKKLSNNVSVNIVGGASKVGSNQGFNNQKLAMLRATNFIKAAQSDGVAIRMTPSGEVGTNTEKNSPGAEAEQFVKIEFNKEGSRYSKTAQDNTSGDVKKPGRYSDDTEDFGTYKFKMCLGDLTGAEYMELLKRFKNKVKSRSVQ